MAFTAYEYTDEPNAHKWCNLGLGRPKAEYHLATRQCTDCHRIYCEACAKFGCFCRADD